MIKDKTKRKFLNFLKNVILSSKIIKTKSLTSLLFKNEFHSKKTLEDRIYNADNLGLNVGIFKNQLNLSSFFLYFKYQNSNYALFNQHQILGINFNLDHKKISNIKMPKLDIKENQNPFEYLIGNFAEDLFLAKIKDEIQEKEKINNIKLNLNDSKKTDDFKKLFLYENKNSQIINLESPQLFLDIFRGFFREQIMYDGENINQNCGLGIYNGESDLSGIIFRGYNRNLLNLKYKFTCAIKPSSIENLLKNINSKIFECNDYKKVQERFANHLNENNPFGFYFFNGISSIKKNQMLYYMEQNKRIQDILVCDYDQTLLDIQKTQPENFIIKNYKKTNFKKLFIEQVLKINDFSLPKIYIIEELTKIKPKSIFKKDSYYLKISQIKQIKKAQNLFFKLRF